MSIDIEHNEHCTCLLCNQNFALYIRAGVKDEPPGLSPLYKGSVIRGLFVLNENDEWTVALFIGVFDGTSRL